MVVRSGSAGVLATGPWVSTLGDPRTLLSAVGRAAATRACGDDASAHAPEDAFLGHGGAGSASFAHIWEAWLCS